MNRASGLAVTGHWEPMTKSLTFLEFNPAVTHFHILYSTIPIYAACGDVYIPYCVHIPVAAISIQSNVTEHAK